MTRTYDWALRPAGILSSQLPLLSLIDEASTITMRELADQLFMDPTTLGRNLKPLERDQLITVTTGQDRRERLLQMTRAGEDVLIKAYPLWQSAQEQIEELLGGSELRSLIQGLKALQGRISVNGHPA